MSPACQEAAVTPSGRGRPLSRFARTVLKRLERERPDPLARVQVGTLTLTGAYRMIKGMRSKRQT